MNRTVSAQLKYLRISPRKVRMVVDSVRGLSVNEAEARLLLLSRRPSEPILKLIRSAVANAGREFKDENLNHLYIKEIRVDQGPKYKRWTPRAQGSVSAIEKRTSHVSVVLAIGESISEPRFKIAVREKKSKKGKGVAHSHHRKETESHEEKKDKDDAAPEGKFTKQPGVVKRIFRRKAI